MARREERIEIHRPVVWVTGASRGIGYEIARAFALLGCQVALSARDRRGLANAVKEISKLGGLAFSVPCDIASPNQITRAEAQIRKRVGSVDVLVNNAGVTVFKDFIKTSTREFEEIIRVNLLGQILCMKAVLPGMTRRKGGWIINIVSSAAMQTFTASSAYTASKAGLLGLANVVREELRAFNVRVVNVIPGPVDTEMWSAADRKKYGHRMMPAKRVGEAVLALYQMPPEVVPELLVLKPIEGDID